jgi:hypothetical protein
MYLSMSIGTRRRRDAKMKATTSSEIRRAYLGWTILQRSCELAAYARELGDERLTALLDKAAELAAAHVGASRTLLERIRRDIAEGVGKPAHWPLRGRLP